MKKPKSMTLSALMKDSSSKILSKLQKILQIEESLSLSPLWTALSNVNLLETSLTLYLWLKKFINWQLFVFIVQNQQRSLKELSNLKKLSSLEVNNVTNLSADNVFTIHHFKIVKYPQLKLLNQYHKSWIWTKHSKSWRSPNW